MSFKRTNDDPALKWNGEAVLCSRSLVEVHQFLLQGATFRGHKLVFWIGVILAEDQSAFLSSIPAASVLQQVRPAALHNSGMRKIRHRHNL